MGASSFLVREIARARTQASLYFVHIAVMTLLVSCAVTIMAWLLVPQLGYSAELLASIQPVTLAIAPGVLRTIQEAVLVAHQRVEFITYSTLVASVFTVGATLGLLHSGHGIVSVVVVFMLAQYLVAMSYLFLIHRYVTRLRWAFRIGFAWDLLRHIKVFAGSSLLGGLCARPEILLLSFFRNDAQIGFYSAALRMTDLWQAIPETYLKNVFPVLSRAHHTADAQQCQVIVDKSIKYLLAISLPLAAGTCAAARPLVHWLYGPSFEPSVAAVRIMAWCIPLTFVFELLWRLLAARDNQHLMLRAQVVTTLARLAGGYALIATMASLGAAINVLVTGLGHNLLLGFYAQQAGTRLGIWRLGWRLAVAALGMGVVAAVLATRSALWVVVPAGAALYATTALLLRALSLDEVALFRKMWRARAAD